MCNKLIASHQNNLGNGAIPDPSSSSEWVGPQDYDSTWFKYYKHLLSTCAYSLWQQAN